MKRMRLLWCVVLFAGILAGCAQNTKKESVSENFLPAEETGKASDPAAPADFRFALVFDVYGIASYDSVTGKLVKTTDTARPEKYVTYYFLTEEEKNEIYRMMLKMDPESYPDEYDPCMYSSEPSRDIILHVKYGAVDKTIACKEIDLLNHPKDETGRAFLDMHDLIVGILKSSAEWKALPDYEVFYE
ncbi:MAG: hypothetical protein J6Z38_01660 [Lachnospiraceae bacterium]|nr:hypothetical protein [Lachnospiraceae bacterium]